MTKDLALLVGDGPGVPDDRRSSSPRSTKTFRRRCRPSLNTRHEHPVKVTVTGAAGQIGYALLFRIASGQMLGPDTPVHLNLLEIPTPSRPPRAPRWSSTTAPSRCSPAIDIHDDPKAAFDGCNVGLLVGARPRGPGMERADLLEANGGIFKPQGEAINAGAADDIKVLVVGNPANTNALIALSHAPDVPTRALHGDDAPRPQPGDRAAGEQARRRRLRRHQHDRLGQPLGHPVPGPGPRQGQRRERRGEGRRQAWIEDEFIPTVAKRGAAIIDARGASSAASAANAAIDHVHDWVNGTPEGDWVSMGVPVGRLLRRRRGTSSPASRAPARAASTRSSRASRSTTSPASGSTPASPSSRASATRSRSSA